MRNYTVVHATFRKSGAQEAMVKYANQNPVLWYTPHSGWEIRIYS
jgi:hypothetical protein